jgi:hypothetical protein
MRELALILRLATEKSTRVYETVSNRARIGCKEGLKAMNEATTRQGQAHAQCPSEKLTEHVRPCTACMLTLCPMAVVPVLSVVWTGAVLAQPDKQPVFMHMYTTKQ